MAILYIQKATTTDKGVPVTIHVVTSVRCLRNITGTTSFLTTVSSWPTLEAMVSMPAVDTQQYTLAPDGVSVFDSSLFDWATSLLLTNTDSWLMGGTTGILNLEEQTLESARTVKRQQITMARLVANRTYFVFQGKQIACDILSRSDIDGVNSEVALTGNLPVGFPMAWKAIDNSFVLIPDVATWTLFVQAMVAQGVSNFIRSERIKAIIDTATMEQLNQIYWDMELPVIP